MRFHAAVLEEVEFMRFFSTSDKLATMIRPELVGIRRH